MNVQGFIASQEDPQKEIMTVLRSWVLDVAPHVQEKITNRIPFFYFFGPLCYLSPRRDGLELAFSKGHYLDDDSAFLSSQGRKQVRSRVFHSVAELEEHEETIRRLLNQAAILNEYNDKTKKKKAGKK
jgi:hypothetical protein